LSITCADVAAVEIVGGVDGALKRAGEVLLFVEFVGQMAGGALQATDSSAMVISVVLQSANVVPEVVPIVSGVSNVSVKSGASLKNTKANVGMMV